METRDSRTVTFRGLPGLDRVDVSEVNGERTISLFVTPDSQGKHMSWEKFTDQLDAMNQIFTYFTGTGSGYCNTSP